MQVRDDGNETFTVIFSELGMSWENEVSGLSKQQAHRLQGLAGKMFDAGMRHTQRQIRLALGINIGD